MSRKSGFLGFGKNKYSGDKTELPRCRVCNSFLLPDEIAFYKVLQPAVADIFIVCPKVSLNQVFYPEKLSEKRTTAGPIAGMQVDFLLCDSTTWQPVLGVELDPEPRELENLQEKSFLIDEIFITAGLPLARIFVSSAYDPVSLRDSMIEAAGLSGAPAGESVSEITTAALQGNPEVETQQESAAKTGEVTEIEPPLEDKAVLLLPEETEEIEEQKPESDVPVKETIITEPAEPQPGETDYAGANSEFTGVEQAANGFETNDQAGRDEEPGLLAEDPPADENIPVEKGDADTVVSSTAGNSDWPEIPEQNLPAQPDKPAVAGLEELKKKVIEEAAAAVENSPAPLCPQCKVPMELRTSKRGIRFYCCPNFAVCREVRGLYE